MKKENTSGELGANQSPISPTALTYRMLVTFLLEILMEIDSMLQYSPAPVTCSPSLNALTSKSRAAADSR